MRQFENEHDGTEESESDVWRREGEIHIKGYKEGQSHY